jgi:hypothetical protein
MTEPVDDDWVWLRNEHLEVGFDRRTGALIALTALRVAWAI